VREVPPESWIPQTRFESGKAAPGVEEMDIMDINVVKSCTRDLKSLLAESDITERKAFLRSFIKRIEIAKGQEGWSTTVCRCHQTGR